MDALREQVKEVPQLRTQVAEMDALREQVAEVPQLRAQVADVQALRAHVELMMQQMTTMQNGSSAVVGPSVPPQEQTKITNGVIRSANNIHSKVVRPNSAKTPLKRGRASSFNGSTKVVLKSAQKRNVIVGSGILVSKDPKTKVEDEELGNEFWQVQVNVVVPKENSEKLLIPINNWKTLGEALGSCVPWPISLIQEKDC